MQNAAREENKESNVNKRPATALNSSLFGVPPLKKQRISKEENEKTAAIKKLQYLRELNQCFLGADNMLLPSFDKTQPDYEIQPFSASLLKAYLTPRAKAFDIEIYCIPGVIDIPEHMAWAYSFIEQYGRYAAKQHGCQTPIFTRDDYAREKIRFKAFVVTIKQTVEGVLLFDSYERDNKKSFGLRFEYWSPYYKRARHQRWLSDYKGDSYRFALDTIYKFLKLDTSVINNIAFRESRVEPFRKNPIKTSFEQFPAYTWEAALSARRKASYGTNLCRVLDKKKELDNKSDNDKQVISTDLDLSLCNSYFNLFPVWDIAQQSHVIQLPRLNSREWRENDKLSKVKTATALPLDCQCVLIEEEPPQFAKTLAEHYSYYLRREYGYDVSPYTQTCKKNTDMFFVLNKKHTLCFGVFIFMKNEDDFYKRCKYDFFQQDINIKAEGSKKNNLLEVAWLHPFCRGKGILSALWPFFKARYGVIDVDAPSEGMKHFLQNHTDEQVISGSHMLVM